VWGVVGQETFVIIGQSSIGFNSLTSYLFLILFMLVLFWEAKLYSCKCFVSNIIENLICITFVHICHVLKIEN